MQIPSSVFWRGHTSLGELSLLLKVALLGSQLRIGRVAQMVTSAIVGGAPHQHAGLVPLRLNHPLSKRHVFSQPSKLAPRALTCGVTSLRPCDVLVSTATPTR